jgi:di/tricarboxylate transporter
VVIFGIASVLPINMGALAFAAAFIVGSVIMDMTSATIFAGFPSDLFLTLVGVTYLFGIAQNNGTIDWLIERAVLMVRGHVAWIPWVMFVVAALLTGFGALSPAVAAILAPIALNFAVQYRINPVLMGLMVIHGAQGGSFSPVSIFGGITNQIVASSGLPYAPFTLFITSLLFNLGIAMVVFVVFGGLRSARLSLVTVSPGPALHAGGASLAILGHGGTPASPACHRMMGAGAPLQTVSGLDGAKLSTLVGLLALAISALVFKFNIGLVAMTVAVVLAMFAPAAQKAAIDKVSWSTVLLITGIITYIGVMQTIGTIDYVAHGISGLGEPLLVALLLCFTAAIISSFASSTALLGVIIPLAVPFLSQGHISAVGVVAAIAISTTIVDTSPFSTNGALVVANTPQQEREKVLRSLLIYSAVIALVGPCVAWLTLVVPGVL